ncbi:DUF58 domain-containing protein [Modestobacter roseus]|uniref:Uncharacterized protein (DUF58 family) n=1 Tax=Modestobacter roseus TaxID=1181884 RepID=A0A562INS3_9ACTN|nr:DUF58 domain-containing protein [Modestobacter roseus]MQA32360.1 DUF58 domain-containing protein [Modestobacter roseus]TWH72375.1 uncharacterized protein (DUF58 family) [Modestobacter roseus]
MARTRIGDAVSSLTLRGRCLVAAGVTLALLGALLGERTLLQLALFVLALPVLSAVGVARQRFRLASRRSVTPGRVPRGDDASVLLEVTNTDRRPGGLWLLAEQVPAELGARPQFVVERLAAGVTAALRYRVHGGRRGRFALGPLRLRLVDPFGLVLRTAAGADTAALVVVPRVRPLSGAGPLAGVGGSGGEGARRSIAVHGEDDVSTREYRHGDDLRMVHWRATARTGELMVRLEERPWRASATLLLDCRSTGHLLGGTAAGPAGDTAPPTDTLEWLIEAAASIGSHLIGRGAGLRVVTEAGELRPATGARGLGAGELLDSLAELAPSRHSGLEPGLQELRRGGDAGPVVALLGLLGPDDVQALARARSGPGTDLAVLVDPESWLDAGAVRGRRPLAPAARAQVVAQQQQAADLLAAAGWRIALARADAGVEQLWETLGDPAARVPA